MKERYLNLDDRMIDDFKIKLDKHLNAKKPGQVYNIINVYEIASTNQSKFLLEQCTI